MGTDRLLQVPWPSGLRRPTQDRFYIVGVGSNPTGTIFGFLSTDYICLIL